MRGFTVAAAVTMLFTGPSFAGRGPTYDELTRIEDILRANGFVSWEEIELEGDVWEVEEARRANGDECEVEIDAETYHIIELDC